MSGCLYFDESNPKVIEPDHTVYPKTTLCCKAQSTPIPAPTHELYENLVIDNISSDLNNFQKKGWQDLYERGEFDCSRMTTYMWDHIRNKYRIAPEIVIAPDRQHAWLAVRVVDAGDTQRYLQWTIKGIKYYYIEATVPQVVKYETDFYMGPPLVRYESSADFYTTKIILADDPVDANTIAGKWFNEFRLTKPDLDKLDMYAISSKPQIT
ncbi:Uncharacterised protein [uncultured archaeon]|nr:Uncharacterised protein [uncultured archaeon]